MRPTPPLAAAILAVALGTAAVQAVRQLPPFESAEAYAEDLASRRARLMAALGPETVLVLWSAPPRVYSGDVDYPYRQESNLLYLSGIEQPETTLVLLPGSSSHREIVFVRQRDPVRALWDGEGLTPGDVRALSGISHVVEQRGTEAFDAFMASLLSGDGDVGAGENDRGTLRPDPGAFGVARREGKARLAVLDVGGAGGETDPGLDAGATGPEFHEVWATKAKERHPDLALFAARDLIRGFRQIKTPYEQRLLARSVEISAEAQIRGMQATRPGRWEYEVKAAVEHWQLVSGALSWGYPSIVGSGPNATSLHYLASTRQMRDGELLLVDAAGSYHGMTGDITRTYPVNGRYSPEQRTLYELVLRAQEAGIAAARPGATSADINKAVRAVFAEGLAELGLVAEVDGAAPLAAQVSLWFPHGPTHGIGIDVHDPLGRLTPGAAFVVEPGLYIRADAFERLPASPGNDALRERLAPAIEKYLDIGVRIEDSFIMSETGPVILSDRVPRAVNEIEKLVGTGP